MNQANEALLEESMPTTQSPRRILLLMSDTGGGHRAAATAIQAALENRYPGAYTFDMVDAFRYYTPTPFKHMPRLYPLWVNHARSSWGTGYRISDGPHRSKLVMGSFYVSWRRGFRRLFDEHPADLVVCVHSLFNHNAMRVLQDWPTRPRFVTVVTDLVSTHAFWYNNKVDLCLVPTQTAYERGLRYKMQPEKMKITGLPVHPDFVAGLTDKQQAREELGWDVKKLTVLLVSGGDAMGPLFKTARAINDQKLDIQLVIIAGRNAPLKAKLEGCDWNQTTHIYPFTEKMAQMMSGADILVTKAGPATISEAFVAGIPMILSGHVPGQEDGNVRYVIESGAGVYAPGPTRVAEVLAEWVSRPPDFRQRYADAAKQIGSTDAASQIADEIHGVAQAAQIVVHHPRRSPRSLLSHRLRPNIARPRGGAL
ncbi:MAG: galactosyldiacylglycerol synthase [Chloroflexi bacterium]|nr:galactosyldiacylglycerol synthase [Chloroflexota bacterium]